MKKLNIKQLLFVLLPAVAVFVAAMPSSVQILPTASDQAAIPFCCSYFTLIDGVSGAIALPCAGLCAGITLMLAGIWAANRKTGLLNGIIFTSLAGSLLAVVPVLLKNEELLILPNVVVPIALLVEYLVAYSVLKQERAADKTVVGKRLK